MTEIERKVQYRAVLLNANWARLLCWLLALLEVPVVRKLSSARVNEGDVGLSSPSSHRPWMERNALV